MCAESLILESYKSVLDMFGNAADFNDSSVLITVCRVDYLAFVIIQYSALREHTVNVVCFNIRRADDDSRDIDNAGKGDGKGGADRDKYDLAALCLFWIYGSFTAFCRGGISLSAF